MFKPYSPEIHGDLEEYLRRHNGGNADNLFHGVRYFMIIKEKGWMIPRVTYVRVDRSPIPDICYVVDSKFMLQGSGIEKDNMSLIDAERGSYDPKKELKERNWSIYWLMLKGKV